MTTSTRLPFNVIDFALPVQKFRIEYTIIGKNSFPFVREFLLRLLNMSSMSAEVIADYMGFSQKEIRIAVSHMMDLNEIAYSNDGLLSLTPKAVRYFDIGENGEPRLTKAEIHRKSFLFDLVSFNYINRNVRLSNPNQALKIHVNAEVRSKSAKMAEKAFQQRFYEIYDAGDIGQVTEKGNSKPDIYKISDVTKQRDDFYRITQEFSIDVKSGAIDRSTIGEFRTQEDIVTKITETIESSRRGQNIEDVAIAMEYFKDDFGLAALTFNGLDLQKYLVDLMENKGLSGRSQLFGSLLMTKNWDRVVADVKKQLDSLKKANVSVIPKMRWFAPSNAFWGRSVKLREAIDVLLRLGKKVESKNTDYYDFELLLPVADKSDRPQIGTWRHELRDYRDNMHAYVEGYFKGNVEVLILQDCFVFVMYHLVTPGSVIPLPIGFYSNDLSDVTKVDTSLKSYLNEVTGDFSPKYIGKIF